MCRLNLQQSQSKNEQSHWDSCKDGCIAKTCSSAGGPSACPSRDVWYIRSITKLIFICSYLFILFIGFLVSNQLIIGKASVLWRFVLSCLMVHACTILRCMHRVPLFEALPPTLWDCHLRYKHKCGKTIRQNKTKQSSKWCTCGSYLFSLLLSHM